MEEKKVIVICSICKKVLGTAPPEENTGTLYIFCKECNPESKAKSERDVS